MMKSGERMTKSYVFTGLMYLSKAKPHLKETVLYHQPVFAFQTAGLPLSFPALLHTEAK